MERPRSTKLWWTVACAVSLLRAGHLSAQVSSPQTERSLNLRLQSARAQLDSALRTGAWDNLVALFTDDARILRGRDVIEGRAAIMGALSMLRADAATAQIDIQPRLLDLCTDGAYERGGEYYLVLRTRDMRSETHHGRYSVRWVILPDGSVRIRELGLASLSAAATPRLSPCRLPSRRSFARRHLYVSVAMGAGQRNTYDDLETAKTGRGYGTGNIDNYRGFRGSTHSELPLLGSVRVRFGPVSLEALGTPLPTEIRSTGCCVDSSYIITEFTGRQYAFLLGGEWRGLRLGVGPTIVPGDWAVTEDEVRLTGGGGFVIWSSRGSAAWSEMATGIAMQLAYVYGVGRNAFFEGRIVRTAGLEAQTRPTNTYAPVTVSHDLTMVYLGLGAAF